MGTTPLIIRITGDASAFRQVAGEVTGVVQTMGQGVDRASNRIESLGASLSKVGQVMTVGVTAPILALAGGALKASADIDTLKRALLSTAGSAGEASKQFERLKEIAKLPGIGLEEAVRGSIRLQNYGVSVGQAEKALRGFSNAVAAAGGSADDTQEALRQLGQIFGRQKVTMDNLRIVLERVPQAAKIIREEFGAEALADPAKALEALGVNSEKFVNILIDRLAEAPKVTAGLKTGLENLGQEVKITAARIGDELAPAVLELLPKLEKAVHSVGDLVKGFVALPPEAKNAAYAIAAIGLSIGPISALLAKLIELRVALVGIGARLGGGVIAGTAGIAGGALLASVIQTSSAIDRLKEQSKHFVEEQERMKSGFENLIDPVEMEKQKSAVDVLKMSTADLFKTLLGGSEANKEAADSSKKIGDALDHQARKTKEAAVAHKAASIEQALAIEQANSAWAGMQKGIKVLADVTSAHKAWGTQLELVRDPLHEIAILTDEYQQSLQRLQAVDIRNLPMPEGMIGGLPTSPGNVSLPSDFPEFGKRKEDNVGPTGATTKEQFDAMKDAAKGAGREASRAMRAVSLVVNDLARGIAKSIIEWKGMGEMVRSVGKNIAEALLRSALEAQLMRLGKLVLKLVGDFGGLGKVINGVFGSGSSGPGGTIFSAASGGAGAAASSVGGAASGIGGAVGGGLTSMVTAASSVVSAFSGVVSNFQFAHMNTALGRIEESTRYVKIWTGEQSQSILWSVQKTAEYMGYAVKSLDMIGRMTSEMLAIAQQGGKTAAAGGGGVQVNMAGAYLLTDSTLDDFAYRLVQRLKENGL